MVARQFGFVVARALAVYAALHALVHFNYILSFFAVPQSSTYMTIPVGYKVGVVAVEVAMILVATLLWTGADKFGSSPTDDPMTARGGPWVIRLVFCCIGGVLAISALGDVATTFARQWRFIVVNEASLAIWVETGVSVVKLLIGLGLVFSNRFDRLVLAPIKPAADPASE